MMAEAFAHHPPTRGQGQGHTGEGHGADGVSWLSDSALSAFFPTTSTHQNYHQYQAGNPACQVQPVHPPTYPAAMFIDDTSIDLNRLVAETETIDLRHLVSDTETRTLLDIIQPLPTSINYVTPPEDDRLKSASHTNQKKRPRFTFYDQLISPAKRSRVDSSHQQKSSFIVKGKEMRAFFNLLDDPVVGAFLSRDSCRRVADKYLLAMTFVFFKRAGLSTKDYSRMNFFLALYLANDMEEDDEDGKYEIFPWALGPNWQHKYPGFIRKRDKLWKRIGYRAVVSRKCCEEVMSIEPDSPVWRRDRPAHHGGATRDYQKSPDDDGYPRGPDASPNKCYQCDLQQYDSAGPDSPSWYISSSDTSVSPTSSFELADTQPQHKRDKFDMDGLKDTLDEFSIWAHGSEE